MATRTRQEYLKDLAKNYVTATTVETGQKFCKSFLIFVFTFCLSLVYIGLIMYFIVFLQQYSRLC